MIDTPNRPYYDDYKVTKGFLKVLFKPGLSVQTRELNQLQSILQNQIGTLADSIYKDGSVVKDGRLIFKNDVDYVKLESSYNGNNFNYSTYKGRMVYGQTTQIVASVFDGFDANNTNPGTLYLNYLSSGVNQEKTFQEDEVLQLVNNIYVTNIDKQFIVNEVIKGENSKAEAKLIVIDNNNFQVVYLSDNRFQIGELISGLNSNATCIYASGETESYFTQVKNSASIASPIGYGSFVILSRGVYYVDNYFVNVDPQQLLISEYDSLVSAKVGFNKEVVYITSTDDSTLYDNANGTPNENAPGADRLYLKLNLGYYNLFDNVPEQFIEIMRINNSNVIFNTSTDSQWSNIIDLLAKRTYDESGNYTVNPFIVNIQEFFNENDNNGIYKESYFAFNNQIQANNASVEIFGASEPGISHRYDYKYYPLATHDEFLQACRDRVCVGINPGLAYVLGYEVDLASRIYVPMLKARELGTDYNSFVNVKYGNYVLVKNVSYLPDIATLQEVILSNNSTFSVSSKVGTARIRMIRHHSGDYGTENEVFRVYLTNINMDSGKTFANDVRSMGIDAGNTFKAVLVNTTIYDIDKNILVYKLPQNAVNSLDRASYEYEYMTSGSDKVDNTGLITVSAPDSNSAFYTVDPSYYVLTLTSGTNAGKVVNLQGKLSRSDNGNTLYIQLDASEADNTYKLIASVRRNNSNVKKKTLVSNAETKIANPSTSMVINHTDGYRLIGVYDSGDKNTAATTSDKNITANYTFDGGQRDTYYDRIVINQIPNTQSPTGQLLIIYDYFNHGAGDYFCADSYTGQIDYADIPTYTNENSVYDLKNCLDFRPKINDNGDGFDYLTNPRIITPDTNFSADVSYYLPRIDLLEVDYLGNFKIKQGTSAINPQTPSGDLNAMILYYFEIPSYTQNINDIVKKYKENKRFTMRDIGLLETRINAMENYILLTQNEYDITNMPIIDTDGISGYKTGYIADNFNDFSYGEITNTNFRSSIDIDNNTLRPSYKLNTVILEKDNTYSSSVSEYNGKYTIPKTDVDAITQTVGTSLMRLNESELVSWEGNLLISPSVNNIYNNINQNKQNFGEDTNYLTEFNGVVENTENNLEYNKFFTSWLGVK